MIRKSALIIIGIAAAVAAFFIFVLGDSFVEDLAEFSFGKILKTEVDIDGLDIELASTTAGLESISIKDPDDLSVDLITTGSAEFDLIGMQLLAKKLAITEMSLNDVVIDSELKKLDRSKDIDKESVEASVGKLADNLPELDLDVLARELDIDQYVHPEKLKSIQAIKKAEKEGKEKIAYWDDKLKTTTLDKDIKQIQKDADKLRRAKLKTIFDYQKAIEDLKKLETKTNKTIKEVNELNKKANEDLKFVSTNYSEIKRLTEEDIKGAEKLANLKDINAKHIGMMLFGREVVAQYEQVMRYLEIARGFFGEKEEKPKRKEGRTISFPVTSKVYPGFLIEHLNINGQLTKKAQPMISWAGSVNGLTLEQNISGEPTVFDISGDEIGKPTKYHVQGVFDNRGETDVYKLALKGTQLELKKVDLKKGDKTWPDHFSSKDAELTVELRLNQVTMEGTVLLVAKSIQFGFAGNQTEGLSETDRAVRETFEDIKSVEIKSVIKGKLDNPQFSVSSNVDRILAKRLEAMVGKKIREARATIRNNIEGQVNRQQKAADNRLNRERQKVLKQVNTYQEQIKAERKNLERRVKEYEKKQKKVLEDEARKKLQNLFR